MSIISSADVKKVTFSFVPAKAVPMAWIFSMSCRGDAERKASGVKCLPCEVIMDFAFGTSRSDKCRSPFRSTEFQR